MTDAPRRKEGPFDANAENNNRNNNNDEVIRREIENLRRLGDQDAVRKALLRLSEKYPEEIFDVIAKRNRKNMKRIRDLAEKVARKVVTRYHDDRRPLHMILEKMASYKDQNKWSDMEYDFFRKE